MSGEWYFDSSAIVKLVIAEAESSALSGWLIDKARLVTCALARVEVSRAVRIVMPAEQARIDLALSRFASLELTDRICERAAIIGPVSLRSLDAIHLASALSLGAGLAGIVTYDRRLALAAAGLGIAVEAPGSSAIA